MSILFQCACGKTLSASDQAAGKHARCPACKAIVPIPAAAPVVAKPLSQPASQPLDLFYNQLADYPTADPWAQQAAYQPPRLVRPKQKSKSSPWLLIGIGATAGVGMLGAIGIVLFMWLGRSANGITTLDGLSFATVLATKPSYERHQDSGNNATAPNRAASTFQTQAAFALAANDPLKPIVDQFLLAARRGSSWDALKLLDQTAFEQRLMSEKGSERAQYHGLETKKIIGNFCSNSFESMPLNGGVRHWDVVAKTKFDGQNAIVLRYYCEPIAPYRWAYREATWNRLAPLITFDSFKSSTANLFEPQPGVKADFGDQPPSQPRYSGLLLPRVGYVTLVFQSVDGLPRLVDIVNSISNLSLSRCGGELFLRDYRMVGGSIMRGPPKTVATACFPSVFGEFPKLESLSDVGQDTDSAFAYYRRYRAPNEKPQVFQPLAAELRTNRIERLKRLVGLLDANSKDLEPELKNFRSDFRNDQAGDMIVVSFAMMRDEPEFHGEAVRGVAAAADRLYKETGDPYLPYVRWYVANRSGDAAAEEQIAGTVANSVFFTTAWHQQQVESAVEAGTAIEVVAKLKAMENWWNPIPTNSKVEAFDLISQQWKSITQRLEKSQGDLSRPDSRGQRESLRRSISGSQLPSLPSGPNSAPMASQPNPGANEPGRDARTRGPYRPSGPPAPSGPGVTVQISSSGQIDIGSLTQKLVSKLKTGNYQASHSGGAGTIFLGYAGDIQTVIDAIDFGTVESSDSQKREIQVKVP